MPLGDRKPSQLLAEMRSKAANTPVTDDLLKQLWMRNMPEQVGIILSADDSIAINTLATMADRVIEATRNSKYVNAIQPMPFESNLMQQSLHSMNVAPITIDPMSKINQIEQQMVELTRSIQNLVKNNSLQRRNSFSGHSNQPRDKSPHPHANNNGNQEPKRFENCWWHFKFGNAAMKCKPPCNFNNAANNQNVNNNSGN